MPRYELIEKCLFVDAYYLDNLDINKPLRNPPAISPMPGDPAGAATAQVTPASSSPKAHVMDKRSSPAKYLALNDVAGFIARFIVQGVDTDLYLPQIIVSEYGISPDQAKNDIKNVLDWLLPYLKSRTSSRTHEPAQNLGQGQHSGVYELNFKVNPLGMGVFKGPI